MNSQDSCIWFVRSRNFSYQTGNHLCHCCRSQKLRLFHRKHFHQDIALSQCVHYRSIWLPIRHSRQGQQKPSIHYTTHPVCRHGRNHQSEWGQYHCIWGFVFPRWISYLLCCKGCSIHYYFQWINQGARRHYNHRYSKHDYLAN